MFYSPLPPSLHATRTCTPQGSKCAKGQKIDMRFAVGELDGCAGAASLEKCGTNIVDSCSSPDVKNGCVGYKTHFYCGKVDKFSSFNLVGSYSYLATVAEKKGADTLDLGVFQTGKLGVTNSDTRLPETSQGSRIRVFDSSANATRICGGNATALIANFLVYNATLTGGVYKYQNREPVGNGFESTCHDGTCQFDSSMKCLTDPSNGISNCARCHSAGEVIPPALDIRVLTSYYGTDKNGAAMLSGSSNPLNFRKFAVAGLTGDLLKVCRVPMITEQRLRRLQAHSTHPLFPHRMSEISKRKSTRKTTTKTTTKKTPDSGGKGQELRKKRIATTKRNEYFLVVVHACSCARGAASFILLAAAAHKSTHTHTPTHACSP